MLFYETTNLFNINRSHFQKHMFLLYCRAFFSYTIPEHIFVGRGRAHLRRQMSLGESEEKAT